jgi:hypothetical protein
MTVFDNILNILLPNYPTHPVFELANRLKSQHFLGLLLALCTIGLYPYVGQAGIGNVNQVQVSNHSPVPFDTVVAQPQMLFLVLDQHLNRPSFQIVGYNSSHRSTQVISNQSYMLILPPATREDDLNCTQLVELPDSFSQPVRFGFTQAGNVVPLALVSQNIPAVFAKFSFNRTIRKPSISLAYANIMPSSLFAGIDYYGAQIKSVKQNSNLEPARQRGTSDCPGCQFSKLAEGDFEAGGMLFLNVQPGTPRDGNTTIIQANLYDGVAGSIFAGGVMTQFANGLHLGGSLESLRIIDDEKQTAVLLSEQAKQHIQSNLLHYNGTVPDTAPEKLPVIRSMSRMPQGFSESVQRCAVTDCDSHYQSPKVLPSWFGEMGFERFEKTLQFSGYFADSNHTASPTITSCLQNCYRLSGPFLFDNCYHQLLRNRSV